MKPKICVSLPARNINNLVSMIGEAEQAGADFVEIRLDYLGVEDKITPSELSAIVGQPSVPLIATNRRHDQGGSRLWNEGQRILSLINAAAVGFQYVDIELTTANLRTIVAKVKEHGAKLIISYHDLKVTPSMAEMERIVKSEIGVGADVCKYVSTANNISDNIQCLLLTRKMSESTKIICFAMTQNGLLSRTLSPFFGAFLTFASIESDLRTAPGQISIADLKETYRRLRVD